MGSSKFQGSLGQQDQWSDLIWSGPGQMSTKLKLCVWAGGSMHSNLSLCDPWVKWMNNGWKWINHHVLQFVGNPAEGARLDVAGINAAEQHRLPPLHCVSKSLDRITTVGRWQYENTVRNSILLFYISSGVHDESSHCHPCLNWFLNMKIVLSKWQPIT